MARPGPAPTAGRRPAGRRPRWDVALRQWIETAFAHWGHAAARHPYPVIAAMLLLAAGLSSQLPKLRVETSVENFLRAGHPARVLYEQFRDQYGRDELIVLALGPARVFDLAFLAELSALHRALEEEVPHLDEVLSLVNARETRGEGDELIVGELLEEWPQSEAELRAIEARARANPLYRNFLLSEDASFTTVLVRTSAFSSADRGLDPLAGFDDDPTREDTPSRAYLTGAENSEAVRAVREIARRFEGRLPVRVAGGPVMEHELSSEMGRNIALFMSLCLLTVAVFLLLLFRRASAVLLPMVVVSLSIVSTFGVMAWFGAPLGIPTQILPSFLLATGVGGAVHLLTIFFLHFDAGVDREEALARALHHAGLAIVMTGITTAGGLVSFVTAEIEPVVRLGWFAPLGIGLGLVYCLVLLPALIAVVPLSIRPQRSTGGGGWIERGLIATGDRSVRHPWIVVACMGVVLLVTGLGIARLDFRYDPLGWFAADHPLRVATETIDAKLHGSFTLEFVVDSGVENGLHEPRVLAGLEAMEGATLALRGDEGLRAGRTTSLADVVQEVHQALNENRPEFRTIPETRQLIAQELLLFENSGTDDLEEIVDSRFRSTRFSVLLPYSPPLAFLGFIDQVEAAFQQSLPPGVRVWPTGVVTLFATAIHAMLASMVRSYLIALAIITPLMFLLLGNLRGGTAAMVPNLAPIVVTLGMMGWLGIALDVFTLLIGSIAIGLAVDDTIHFMHNFRKSYDVHANTRRAVRETLRTTGRALLTTSVVLSLAFFTYGLASLRNLALFGLLTGFTIVVAFVADVVVSPALMELATRRDPRRRAAAPSRRESRC